MEFLQSKIPCLCSQKHLFSGWTPSSFSRSRLLRLSTDEKELLYRAQFLACVRRCRSYTPSTEAAIHEMIVI